MRAVLLVTVNCSFAAISLGGPAPHREWRSPDSRWVVTCECKGTWQPESCSIALSRTSDRKVFFTHHTTDRYIAAAWSGDSRTCVLLDAPDNANSYLWLFRRQGRDIATEKLDYGTISDRIEAAVPAARRQEPAVTRSGIDKIEWQSSRELRLHVTHNNVPVLVTVDVAKPQSPAIHVLPMRPNQAMQLTAPRSVCLLRVATTFDSQPRALPGAVADLVSR
jgi:hypothetical protein